MVFVFVVVVFPLCSFPLESKALQPSLNTSSFDRKHCTGRTPRSTLNKFLGGNLLTIQDQSGLLLKSARRLLSLRVRVRVRARVDVRVRCLICLRRIFASRQSQ